MCLGRRGSWTGSGVCVLLVVCACVCVYVAKNCRTHQLKCYLFLTGQVGLQAEGCAAMSVCSV